MRDFLALDVEVGGRHPTEICAVGAVRLVDGREAESFYSLVQIQRRVRFTSIHGLTARDLAGAPSWRQLWPRLSHLLTSAEQVVSFRAGYDRGAILAACAHHGIRPPPLNFVCAARCSQAKLGLDLSLQEALRSFGIPFPGPPHHALSDARAAAALFIACGG